MSNSECLVVVQFEPEYVMAARPISENAFNRLWPERPELQPDTEETAWFADGEIIGVVFHNTNGAGFAVLRPNEDGQHRLVVAFGSLPDDTIAKEGCRRLVERYASSK